MLFLHLSSDSVWISDGEKSHILPRARIEYDLGPVLVEWVNKSTPGPSFVKEGRNIIWVLNGPGGFTHLRVGAVVVNMLHVLIPDLQILSCTKPEFYHYARSQGVVPQYGKLYLGQKKNTWLWDLKHNIQTDVGDDYFVDWLSDGSYRGEDASRMIHLSFDGNALVITYNGKKLAVTPEQLGLQPVHQLVPEYFIGYI